MEYQKGHYTHDQIANKRVLQLHDHASHAHLDFEVSKQLKVMLHSV